MADGPTTYKIRIRDKADFDPTTLEAREIRKGVTGIWGRLKPREPDVEAVMPAGMPAMPGMAQQAPPEPAPMRLQSLHFDAGNWTLEKAFEWADQYGYQVGRLEFSLQWFAQAEAVGDYVERDADLFEAGEYPDRGLTVTESDIERLSKSPMPVPIFVEHQASKIKLGELTSTFAAGKWLKGRLRLFKEADALLQRVGVRGLSVAITRTLDRIAEVSATDSPRVAGARMFGNGSDTADCVLFAVGEQPTQGGAQMAENANTEGFSEQLAEMQKKYDAELAAVKTQLSARDAELTAARDQAAALEFGLRLKDATARVEGFINAGKLPPTCKDEAISLMLAGGTVQFSGAEKPVSQLVADMLDKLPVRLSKGVTGQPVTDAAAELSDEQEGFFTKNFPGIKLEDAAKFMKGVK